MSAAIRQFDEFGFSRLLLKTVSEVGPGVPSQIQAACISALMAGRDLLAHAPSGTGKTQAYALPVLEKLDPASHQPQALVLTPNHERSLHVAEVFQRYAGHLTDFHVLPLYDQNQSVQLRQLQRGAQVLVGEPRRVMHYVENACFSLANIGILVMDETEEMLRGGFGEDLEWLLARLPEPHQRAIFAASLSDALHNFAHLHLRNPRQVSLAPRRVHIPAIRLLYWPVAQQTKLNALTRLFEVVDGFDAALVYVRSRRRAAELVERLRARGYAVALFDDSASLPLRRRLSEQLERGEIDMVVGTDPMADGLDLARVTHVIGYDMPCDVSSHARRLRRLGDGGMRRKAILLVTPREMRLLRGIERATKQRFTELALPERAR